MTMVAKVTGMDFFMSYSLLVSFKRVKKYSTPLLKIDYSINTHQHQINTGVIVVPVASHAEYKPCPVQFCRRYDKGSQ
jgi:hypothetical protein